MNARWTLSVALLPVALLLTSCGSLPQALREDIRAEHDRLAQAERQLKRSGDTIRDEAAQVGPVSSGFTTDWQARLSAAQAKLDRAKTTGAELDKAAGGPGNNEARRRAEQLLGEERSLRLAALHDAEAVDSDAAKWLDYSRNAPHYVAKMQGEYDAIRAADLTKVSQAVAKAETDWPAKKADLDARLAALKGQSSDVENQWKATEAVRQEAAAGQLSGPSVATLIQADDALAREKDGLTHGADELTALSGQLYDSWDKILVDLEKGREGQDTVYREKIKTVRTHFTDVPTKKSTVATDEAWTDVSASAYRGVENDLGMAIGHKDAGLYDSEAQNVAQPPGFAYIATPEQGRNQYGYWSHTNAGSFWTFLPEYLIMRELFWGPSYRPIYVNEYSGYSAAQRVGRTYYGNETPAAPPKYGTHGTFTEQRYAGSRYVQSGGFKGSGYASGGGSAGSPSGLNSRSMPSGSSAPSSSTEGKRFGGRPSSGSGFGSPSPTPSGKRFGGGSRSPARSFGGRRR
jgi:hypothetical protein